MIFQLLYTDIMPWTALSFWIDVRQLSWSYSHQACLTRWMNIFRAARGFHEILSTFLPVHGAIRDIYFECLHEFQPGAFRAQHIVPVTNRLTEKSERRIFSGKRATVRGIFLLWAGLRSKSKISMAKIIFILLITIFRPIQSVSVIK